MKKSRSVSAPGDMSYMDVPDDLDRLSSSWSTLSSNFGKSPTNSLLRHMIDCIAVLRDLNQDRGRTGDGEGVLTSAICNSAYNSFSLSVERILMEAMTCQLPPESPAEASNMLDLGSSILRQFPDAAKLEKSGSSQKTLLHRVAIKPAAGVQSVKTVFSYCRKSIELCDAMGALPLHHATHASPPDVTIVRTLIELYPAAAGIADKAGYLPLHWAVNSTNAKVEIVRMLLKAYPKGATMTCNGGSLPLHWSVDRDRPLLAIVEELTNAYRTGLSKPCSLGWLPIHRCVDRSDPKSSVLKWLINQYPNGLRVANCDGQLPLHRLLDRSAPSLSAIKLLVTAYPEALLVPDSEGYLPLHLALDGDNPSARVVCALIEMCPESTSVVTIDGLLPLHCALNCCLTSITPREIILALLRVYPEGAMQEAFDMVPVDPEANPDEWDGPWKQVKWTPLSRAEELEDDELISDIRAAILNPSLCIQDEQASIFRRSSSDSLNVAVSNDISFSTVRTSTSLESTRNGPGWSGQNFGVPMNSEENSLLSSPMIDFNELSLNGSFKTRNSHSRSTGDILLPPDISSAPGNDNAASGSAYDVSRSLLGSGGRKISPEIDIPSGGSTPRIDSAQKVDQGNKLPSLGAPKPSFNNNFNPNTVTYNGIFSTQVEPVPSTPNKELAIDIMLSPHASRDDASLYSAMSRGSMDSSQFSTGSSRKAGGIWVRTDADSVSSSTDGGTFFKRKRKERGNPSGSKFGPGDAMLHDFGAIIEQEEESPPSGENVVRRLKNDLSPVYKEKKSKSRRARKQQREAEKVTTIISQGKSVSEPTSSVLLDVV